MKKSNKPSDALITSIIKIFAKNPFETYNNKQISARLGMSEKGDKQMINNAINHLVKSGTLKASDRGRFKLNPKHLNEDVMPKTTIIGKVDMKQTGKAYVIHDNKDFDDIYIAPNNTNHSLDGDKVKVHLFPLRKGRKQEGQIIEIIERAKKQFVGTMQISKRYAFMVPDNQSIPMDIFIPTEGLNGASDGDKVVVRIVEWPARANNPFGEVIKVLGKPGNNDVEMESVLAEFEFPLAFEKETLSEAERISEVITDKDIKERRDFRGVTTLTIDPSDAKDFDDALSFKVLENGNYEVGVHIADVTHYINPDTILDREAYERATSVYLVDRTIPMLPERLSNFICSLRPDEDKLCFSAVFELNDKAEVVNKWFGKTIIRSDRRFAYEEVQAIIEAGKGEYDAEILKLNELAQKIRDVRFKNGAINFESVEVKFNLDENAKPIGVYIKEHKESNQLIEEFMLLANKYVAEYVGKLKENNAPKTFVYRIHDEPNPEKLSNFSQFVAKLGYKIQIGSKQRLATSFNQLFKDIMGKGEETMIETIAIRTMSKAIYSTENIGHYGLAFPYYTHFTSPIRRYPDMMVHRLLAHYLSDKPSVDAEVYEAMCKHASEMEKKAAEAERMSVKYKQAEYMNERIGQEFDGVISGVSKWGVFVELNESKCEGLVSMRVMRDDLYYLDEENYRVIGRRHGKEYKLGDKVRIRVEYVDLMKKRMDFVFVEEQ